MESNMQPGMEPSVEKPKKSRTVLWIALVVGIILICCCIVASVLLWVNRTEVPYVSELFATPTPLPIPGISEPMTVNGSQFILTSAEFQDSYTSMNQKFTPNTPGRTLLVLEGSVVSEGSSSVGKWDVEVRDENEKSYVSGVKITSTKTTGEITFTWLFAVPEDASELTLYLPDGHHRSHRPPRSLEQMSSPSLCFQIGQSSGTFDENPDDPVSGFLFSPGANNLNLPAALSVQTPIRYTSE